MAAENVPAAFAAMGHRSIQDALAARPGQVIALPPGDYILTEKLRLRGDGSGLRGPARIVQTNAEQPIIEIEKGANIELRDLTLVRPEGKTDTRHEGVLAIDCRSLVLDGVAVMDNRSNAAAIALRRCALTQVRHCRIENYMRISIDDRTASADWGYAFRCSDGTGIGVADCQGLLIEGNSIVERNMLPTEAVQKQHGLGKFVKKNAQKGSVTNQQTWDAEYTDNWRQGSAIVLSAPESIDRVQILGNSIENAAQGIDIHADHVIVAQNIVNNAHVGMKAMHGSRNVLIIGNQFIKNDLWAIGLMPGAASHAAAPAKAGKPAVSPNVDGGSIIANNIISDFGRGNARWIWDPTRYTCCPIRLDGGQKPDNPPLSRVVIQGNIIYDTERDDATANEGGKPKRPGYKFAVLVAGGPQRPQQVVFANNLFDPGTEGISNIPIEESKSR